MDNKLPRVTLETVQPDILDIVHTIYLKDIESYVFHKFIGEPDTEQTQMRIASEVESVKQYLISEGYTIRT